MLALRIDPWDPGYGMGFDAAETDEVPQVVSPYVETQDWSQPIAPASSAAEGGPVVFIDGVRRIEARLIATDGDARAPGLLGAYGVGAVQVNGRATFGAHRIERVVVVGGGMRSDAMSINVGGTPISFRSVSEAGTEPDAPLVRLQQLLRQAEGALARELACEDGALVLADGPLTFSDPTTAPVVGIVKRFHQHYLSPSEAGLVPMLGAGQRTPLFTVGQEGSGVQRYAWYVRLVPMRAPWHDHAGVMRCEVSTSIGLDCARELADRVTVLLPRFAGRASDPRAPQNLAPVGGLETRLRHRLGDSRLIRRAITTHLMQEVARGQ
jgi:uncharacterized protein